MDALTYGLATLVMREDLFENAMLPSEDPKRAVCHNFSCTHCGLINHVPKVVQPSKPRRLKRGNYFSQFTKKFSLGNGPADWVQEYLVTKESGKMLGTLVALSLARMPNLESFMWDMPTGILRDIWISLSSLGEYDPCRLSKVWVRFHDNRTALHDAGLVYPAPTRHDNVMLPNASIPLVSMPSYNKLEFSGHPTECPTFSTLPPLQSLTVLAIDELAYLEEISVLIGRSQDKLRELRIGLAPKINTSGYDDQHPTVHLFAAGTEMALLLNALHKTFDPRSEDYIYRPKSIVTETPSTKAKAGINASRMLASSQSPNLSHPVTSEPTSNGYSDDSRTDSAGSDSTFGLSSSMSPTSFNPEIPLSYASIDPALAHDSHADVGETLTPRQACENVGTSAARLPSENVAPPVAKSEGLPPTSPENNDTSVPQLTSPPRHSMESKIRNARLTLEVLELEGCLLNVFVLTQSVDFSMLTSLTLLHCEAADILWAQLTRQYPSLALKQKALVSAIHSQPDMNLEEQKPLRRIGTIDALPKDPRYQLNLKRIHTDTVSLSLITFLSKTLAPNSLEWLFLQDNPSFFSPITIDAIYKGPLRRHRGSLAKIMIDSSTGAAGSRSRSTSALKWMLNHDLLSFITSGKMTKLRELAMVVEYKDWHFLLQRLPDIPHLRSLYVPHIVNHVYGSEPNVKELAMGVVDVVTLRPEVELCYLGIFSKCFEILEKKHVAKRKHSITTHSTASEDTDEDSVDDDYHQSENDEEDEDGGVPAPEVSSPPAAAISDADDENISSSEEEEEVLMANKLKYKLREILFYDDKISIFKARHGRL